jgi:uncharacterized membrane protein YeiH
VSPSVAADFSVPPAFDHTVVFLWAVGGALVGARKGFDVIGVAMVAAVAAVGGGLVRDSLFLQRTPLILTDALYLPLILAATLGVVVAIRRLGLPPQALTDRIVGTIDAFGIPAYAMIGMQMAMARELPLSGVLVVGFINGTGGGLLRDVLVREVPALLQPGGYAALVVMLACCLFLALVVGLGIDNHVAAPIAIAVGGAVRLLTIRFDWRTKPVVPGDKR